METMVNSNCHANTLKKLKTRKDEFVPQEKCMKCCTNIAKPDSTQVFIPISPWVIMPPSSQVWTLPHLAL
jgi:hypothetical protein